MIVPSLPFDAMVNSLQVAFHGTLAGKPLIAHWTLVGLFSRVSVHVVPQTVRVDKSLLADFTDPTPLAGVHVLVLFVPDKVLPPARPPALFAGVLAVQLHVDLHRIRVLDDVVAARLFAGY